MIHRYWHGTNEPQLGFLANQIIWHDENLPDVVLGWLNNRMDLVPEDDQLRHRANMVRWWLLKEHGGVWLDHDISKFVMPFERPWVATWNGLAECCAMHFPLGHPLPRRIVDLIDAVQSPGYTPEVSGSFLLRKVISDFSDVLLVPMSNGWIIHDWSTSKVRRLLERGEV